MLILENGAPITTPILLSSRKMGVEIGALYFANIWGNLAVEKRLSPK